MASIVCTAYTMEKVGANREVLMEDIDGIFSRILASGKSLLTLSSDELTEQVYYYAHLILSSYKRYNNNLWISFNVIDGTIVFSTISRSARSTKNAKSSFAFRFGR